MPPLPTLSFPDGTPLALREEGGRTFVLDRIRRRWVRLTPEEWVRQHLLRALVEALGYPPGLLAVEQALAATGGPRRADVVAYGRDRLPALIAECKAPGVPIRQAVFDQVSRYNVVARAPHLLVTNGREHYCWTVDRDAHAYRLLDGIPAFDTLAGVP
jgi:hypothetical protein